MIRETQPAIAGAANALERSSPQGARAALRSILQVEALRESTEVRGAIRRALIKAQTVDMRDAAAQTGRAGVRNGSETRELYGALIDALAQLRDRDSLELIARSDHMAIRSALPLYGASAIPAILRALRSPAPTGYSIYYRPALLAALDLVLEGRAASLDTIVRQDIGSVLREVLFRSPSWREVQEAINVSEELDDELLDQRVDALSRDVMTIRAMTITDPTGIAAIQQTATKVSSRRIVIKL
jgi:hypothetical protein